jgi:hypothetical protein
MKFLLASLKTLTNSEQYTNSRIKVLFWLSFAARPSIFSSVLSSAFFATVY